MFLVEGRTAIETIKGRKLTHLSPLTRNLNQTAEVTLVQLDRLEKRNKMLG
jgi:hypothetical protein